MTDQPHAGHPFTDKKKCPIDTWIQGGLLIAAIFYGFVSAGLWWTTREGYHAGQRAYMVVDEIDAPPPTGLITELAIRVRVKNTGETPAIRVHIQVGFATRPPDTKNIDDAPLNDVKGVPDVGKEQRREAIFIYRPPPTELNQLRNGWLVYVRTVMTYDDIFASWWHSSHETRTCDWYDLKLNKFTSCPEGQGIQ